MNRMMIYIHGKGGSAEEAEQDKTLFEDSDVIGFDYTAQIPWEAKEEFPTFFDSIYQKYESKGMLSYQYPVYSHQEYLYQKVFQVSILEHLRDSL